jgi:flagellar protein FliT
MEKEAILAVYEKISGVMNLMVQAAEASDWDALTELEGHCSSYMDTLRLNDHHDGLSEKEVQYKMEVIQKILDDDRKIRELTEPWLKKLSELINHSANSRKVSQAYGFSSIN